MRAEKTARATPRDALTTVDVVPNTHPSAESLTVPAPQYPSVEPAITTASQSPLSESPAAKSPQYPTPTPIPQPHTRLTSDRASNPKEPGTSAKRAAAVLDRLLNTMEIEDVAREYLAPTDVLRRLSILKCFETRMVISDEIDQARVKYTYDLDIEHSNGNWERT